jgi:hypothetical protein
MESSFTVLTVVEIWIIIIKHGPARFSKLPISMYYFPTLISRIFQKATTSLQNYHFIMRFLKP